MRTRIVIGLFAALFLVGTVFAVGSDNGLGTGCKLQGTWIWEVPYPLPWNPDNMLRFFEIDSGTENEGTGILSWINLPHPPGISYSIMGSVWKKSGPNTIDYKAVAFASDYATGAIVWAIQLSGTAVMTDCNTMTTTCVTQPLDPDTLEPVGNPTEGPGTAHRITLEE